VWFPPPPPPPSPLPSMSPRVHVCVCVCVCVCAGVRKRRMERETHNRSAVQTGRFPCSTGGHFLCGLEINLREGHSAPTLAAGTDDSVCPGVVGPRQTWRSVHADVSNGRQCSTGHQTLINQLTAAARSRPWIPTHSKTRTSRGGLTGWLARR